ncbi:MAG: ABC transporter permease [Steroidobacteraceae bacterium]
MTSLRRLLAVASKEIRQLRRDRLTLAMIVGLPLLQMLLFGYAINFDVRDLRAGVVDAAQTSQSRALVASLVASQIIKVQSYYAAPADLEAAMQQGLIKVGVIIPADFERRLLSRDRAVAQLLVDGSEPSVENLARGLSAMPMASRSGIAGTSQPLFEVRTQYNPEKRTAVQVVPGLIGVILSLTMVMFTAVSIVRERERGNLELLITTPVSSAELMTGKLLPYVVIGLIQTTIVLVVGVFLFTVPINGRVLDLYLASLLFIAATLCLGLFISTWVQTQAQAFQMSLFTLLPSILLSGFVFPFEGMPRLVQWLAQLLPLTHFIVLIRGIVLRGASLWDMPAPIYKLLAFLIVLLVAATLRFHKRLD